MSVLATLIASFCVVAPQSAEWPKTAAEASNYTKTSSYTEVMAFLDRLQEKGAPIRIQIIGKSTLGKPIPLVICHRDPSIEPAVAKSRQIPVVYIQANIHAGEVEGKESVLRLLRDLAQNPKDSILDKLVLVVQPIYNSDGNDKWGSNLQNRGHQDGPDPVGERPNGQGLDLNRDCMKAESPEMRAVLSHVYGKWDPEVVMDLHTTNGTRHGYVLTYSPGLNPNSNESVLRFTRDELLPKARREAKRKNNWEFFDYGDATKSGENWIFSSFACDPRYVTNYASIRNRISILSEAASFQPFKLRVETTHWFVRFLLDELARQQKRVVQLVRDADRDMVEAGRTGTEFFGVRFALASRGKEPILLEVERNSAEIDRRKAPIGLRTIQMTINDRFQATQSARMPLAYIAPANSKLAELMVRHGIQVEELLADFTGSATVFRIQKSTRAAAAFQGHRLYTLDGQFEQSNIKWPKGSLVVRTAQPLGLLAFHMLEPESTDGAAAWGFLSESFEVGQIFPVSKANSPINVPTRQL